MRLNVVIRYIGVVLLWNALFMLISAAIGFADGIDTGFYPLLLSFILTVSLATFPMIFVEGEGNINTKEGYLIVVGAWVLSCVCGMLPYLLWGGEFTLANAWFESVSGFTTTGSTVLFDIEALPKSLLFWRSSTHWLGGIGVVMFVLIILPSLGRAKMTLSNMQLSSLAKDNFRYKTQRIIQILLLVYIGLTAIQTVLLWLAGMEWFDAVNHAFSTVATGGFSTKNLSIAYFDNSWIETIVTLFMVIAGLHFGIIYATLIGRRNNVFRSEVSRFYLLSILVAGLAISVNLWWGDIYPTFASAVRYGFFQLVSIITTTGFATANTNVWPAFAIVILIFFSFTCACAGSTSGGIKIDRLLISYKSILAKIKQLRHPNAIIRVKMDNIAQDEQTLSLVNLFIVLYLLFVVAGTLVCALFGIDLMTSFSVAFASMSNLGPGFGDVSSIGNYSQLPGFIKILSTLLMLVGRLEIFGFIQILFLRSWK